MINDGFGSVFSACAPVCVDVSRSSKGFKGPFRRRFHRFSIIRHGETELETVAEVLKPALRSFQVACLRRRLDQLVKVLRAGHLDAIASPLPGARLFILFEPFLLPKQHVKGS